MGVDDIREQIQEMYDLEISTSPVTIISDAVNGEIIVWQNRSLDHVYLIGWIESFLEFVKVLK